MWTCSEGQHHLPGCAASSKRSWKSPKFRVGMFTLGVKGWRDGAGSLRCNCAENATLPLRRGRRCSRDSSPIEVAARVAFDLIRIKPSGIILASKLDRGSEVEKPQRFAGLLLLFLDFFFFFSLFNEFGSVSQTGAETRNPKPETLPFQGFWSALGTSGTAVAVSPGRSRAALLFPFQREPRAPGMGQRCPNWAGSAFLGEIGDGDGQDPEWCRFPREKRQE